MATILITGGTGYVGSHTAKALAAAGHTPVMYSRNSAARPRARPFGPVEAGDINDLSRLLAVCKAHRPSVVVHLAAVSGVRGSVSDPLAYYRCNVAGTLTLLQATKASGVNKVVFASTSAVYGSPDAGAVEEDAPLNPINPYGRSKVMAEMILSDAATADGFHVVALRYFNVAGASLDGDLGDDRHDANPMVLVALRAARSSGALAVFGTDYPTRDGTCVRDYVHVDDVADAHVRAIGCLLSGAITGFEAFNVGTGTGYSVLEIVKAAERASGRPLHVAEAARHPGEPHTLLADVRRAAVHLGWSADRSDLSTIVSSAWRWLGRGGDGGMVAP